MADHPPVNPRKKPRQARAQATYDAILQAAARILAEGGIGALNTNVIADRAGVSVGSLYQYFPNKAAIVTALVRDKRARLVHGLNAAAEETLGASLEVALRALIAATVRHQRGWPQLAQALDRAALLVPMQGETDALEREILGVVSGVLAAHGVARPELSALDLIGLSRGMIDDAMMRGERDEPALVARVMRAASGYLRVGDFD
ncbi:TetR/AcrR family transcriptional regulator [Shimia sp.]|uniref:TetR/AcrR family transcriptional regulator n=1 Tax=Shimia sp. TaxID=1954381 RepID=UPI0032904A92